MTMFAIQVPAYGKVDFKKIWLEHGVYKNGSKGMTVHAHFTVGDMKGENIQAVAWIKDEDGKYLEKQNGHTLGIKHDLNVTYESSLWDDLSFFIPYDDMILKNGKHSYYAFVSIHTDNGCISVSDDIEFTGTGSGENKRSPANRQILANGGSVDRVENADGSITSTIRNTCTICGGSGRCNLCGGQGGLWGGYGRYRTYHICNSCGGGARCKYCGGTGETVMVHTYYPATNESFGVDFYTGNVVSSERGGYGSGSGKSNKKGSCTYCNGTGMDSFAWTSGSPKPNVGGYTHSSGGKCQYCGKYEWHQHVYCPHCQADKY